MPLAGRRWPGSPWSSLRSRQPGARSQTLEEPACRHRLRITPEIRDPFAGTIVWAYDPDSDGNKTALTESYRVTKPVSRIGWMIIEKSFGGHDREGDLRRGIHDTLDAIKAAAESTQNLPPRTRTSHRVNRSVCATHIPAGTCPARRSASER
jgi:hypothetical protein